MRWSNWNVFDLKSTSTSSCFQAFDLFPSFWMLRVSKSPALPVTSTEQVLTASPSL